MVLPSKRVFSKPVEHNVLLLSWPTSRQRAHQQSAPENGNHSQRRTWAGKPLAGVRLNVDLARRVVVAEPPEREDGHEVALAVNVRHRDGLRVDVVRKLLVAHPREAIADKPQDNVGDVQGEVYGVEERERGTWVVLLI